MHIYDTSGNWRLYFGCIIFNNHFAHSTIFLLIFNLRTPRSRNGSKSKSKQKIYNIWRHYSFWVRVQKEKKLQLFLSIFFFSSADPLPYTFAHACVCWQSLLDKILNDFLFLSAENCANKTRSRWIKQGDNDFSTPYSQWKQGTAGHKMLHQRRYIIIAY